MGTFPIRREDSVLWVGAFHFRKFKATPLPTNTHHLHQFPFLIMGRVTYLHHYVCLVLFVCWLRI